MKQTLAAALFALVAAPALASGGAVATPAPAPTCTQLELSIGLRGADCGRYTVGEIILMDETANQD